MIRATAMIDAQSKGQIGQPAARMIENTLTPSGFLQARTLACEEASGKS